ncbi:MAG: thermonuclease family protein [Pseudomonadota bacterium]
MKKCIVCWLVFLVAVPVLGQQNYINEYTGLEWNTMNTGEKKCLIAGIWMGQTPSSLDTPQQPYTYRYAESTTVEDYIKECNVFYSNPEHRKITIIDAYVLATIKLRDDDSDDYGYVLKMLLDNKRLPNRGKVVGVIDGDTIEIEENGTKWEIRLFGIDAPEIDITTQTDKEKYGMKAKQFLSALCLGKRVKLIYRGDYFDKYGRLLANSKLDSDDNYLCKRSINRIFT